MNCFSPFHLENSFLIAASASNSLPPVIYSAQCWQINIPKSRVLINVYKALNDVILLTFLTSSSSVPSLAHKGCFAGPYCLYIIIASAQNLEFYSCRYVDGSLLHVPQTLAQLQSQVPPTPTYVSLLLCYIYNCLSVAFNLQIHCIISYLFCLLPAPPTRMRAEIFFCTFFHLLLYPGSLEKCLTHNRVSKYIC